MPRAPYTPCRLFYDGLQPLAPGDFLQTPAGSAYRIDTIRPSRTRAYRKHLGCTRWPVAEIPSDATVHPLYWYPRRRRPARTLASLRTAHG